MKIRNLILGLAVTVSFAVNAQQISPITKAMLKAYQTILNENPKDYNTLYQRATQYYNLSMYDEALVDIVKALEYTPEKEKDLRIDEYSMLSDIYIQTKDYEKALNAINNALALSPNDYPLLYKKGNAELYLDRPEDAYRSYAAMQRLKSRSQEAFFGMARADIMMNKKDAARELITQAQNADPSNYLTYCRVGELYEDMGEDENAAASYLNAFSLADNNSSRPLESLILLAKKDYKAVETAIQYAISKTDNTDALYFLQASIAFNSGNYNQAYIGFTKLLESREGQIASVYANMARCCMALNKMSEATTNADLAIIKENTVFTQNIKAEVELAAGNPHAALLAATKALHADANSTESLVNSALANMALNDPKAAMQNLDEAAMIDPANLYARMLRAYVNFNMLDNAKDAILEYSRIGNTSDPETFDDIVYQALAQCLAGKKIDADETMKQALRKKEDKTKDDYYMAAVYYAQTGDLEKGKEMIEKALNLGYQNLYNLYTNKTANLNIAPLRHLLSK